MLALDDGKVILVRRYRQLSELSRISAYAVNRHRTTQSAALSELSLGSEDHQQC